MVDKPASGGKPMISLADCIAFCNLDEAEVLAIAEHEHVPEIVACALAEKLLRSSHGPEQIRDMIRDDIRAAIARGDRQHARELIGAMHHFLSEHPEVLVRIAPHAETSG
jgi:hypothetical protein